MKLYTPSDTIKFDITTNYRFTTLISFNGGASYYITDYTINRKEYETRHMQYFVLSDMLIRISDSSEKYLSEAVDSKLSDNRMTEKEVEDFFNKTIILINSIEYSDRQYKWIMLDHDLDRQGLYDFIQNNNPEVLI